MDLDAARLALVDSIGEEEEEVRDRGRSEIRDVIVARGLDAIAAMCFSFL